jgi:hypothetical protein
MHQLDASAGRGADAVDLFGLERRAEEDDFPGNGHLGGGSVP